MSRNTMSGGATRIRSSASSPFFAALHLAADESEHQGQDISIFRDIIDDQCVNFDAGGKSFDCGELIARHRSTSAGRR